MNKWWKIIGITGLLVIILALGTTLVLAQEQPDRPLWNDADGDGLCDTCNLEPGWNTDSWGMGGHMMGSYGGWGMSGSSMLTLLAEKLDVSVTELQEELSAGISIAELAENHGLDVDVLIDELLAERAALLADAVAAGTLSQDQADLMLEHMEEMISAHVYETWTGSYYGPGAGVFGHGGCGRGSWSSGATGSTTRGGRRGGMGL